jgi:hypothetical protein
VSRSSSVCFLPRVGGLASGREIISRILETQQERQIALGSLYFIQTLPSLDRKVHVFKISLNKPARDFNDPYFMVGAAKGGGGQSIVSRSSYRGIFSLRVTKGVCRYAQTHCNGTASGLLDFECLICCCISGSLNPTGPDFS